VFVGGKGGGNLFYLTTHDYVVILVFAGSLQLK
jgi:hypothetical protein